MLHLIAEGEVRGGLGHIRDDDLVLARCGAEVDGDTVYQHFYWFLQLDGQPPTAHAPIPKCPKCVEIAQMLYVVFDARNRT